MMKQLIKIIKSKLMVLLSVMMIGMLSMSGIDGLPAILRSSALRLTRSASRQIWSNTSLPMPHSPLGRQPGSSRFIVR